MGGDRALAISFLLDFYIDDDVPRTIVTFTGGRQFELNTIDAVDAVDKEDEDEDEGDLETVLQLGYEGVFRDETAES